MDDAFALPRSDDEREIKKLIDEYNAAQTTSLEEELCKQRARLVAAERTLQTKPTKAATESKRIAGDKIEATLRRLDDIKRTATEPRDSRIFPGELRAGSRTGGRSARCAPDEIPVSNCGQARKLRFPLPRDV
jgi:hypothetical protein